MDYPTTSTLLSWMVFMPLIGAALILVLACVKQAVNGSKEFLDNASRAVGLATCAIVLLLGCFLWKNFDGASTKLQFVHHFVWMRQFNIEYFLGVDGISITMVLLTALVSFIAMIASLPWWGKLEGHHFSGRKVPGYMVMFLLL